MKIKIIFLLLSFPLLIHGKKIVILGDSLTEGYGVAREDAYPSLLEKELKKISPQYKVINAGTSGATTAIAPSSLKWHLRAKPNLILLALGANDGLRGLKTEATKKNLAKAIQLIQKNNIQVILVGMKLPFNYGKEYRTQFEKMYQDLAKKYKIPYLPFLLKGVGGIKKYNLSDGIHPNELGHKKIAQTVFTFIRKYL